MSNKPTTIFISYSWDGNTREEVGAYRNKIQQEIGDPLRAAGFDVVADFYPDKLDIGAHIPTFMFDEINKADRVLVVCTPNYVAKANNPDSGVATEGLIIKNEITKNIGTTKFIPIFMYEDKSLPVYLQGRVGLEFHTPELISENLEKLIERLRNGNNVNSGEQMLKNSVQQNRDPVPIIPKVFSEMDKKKFRNEAFTKVQNLIEEWASKLGSQKGAESLVEPNDNNSFKCTVEVNGKIGSITISKNTGAGHGVYGDIYYCLGDDYFVQNSSNGGYLVDTDGSELFFKPDPLIETRTLGHESSNNRKLQADDVALFFWERLLAQVGIQ